jgi:predicted RNA-binding Zn-ribbon protein involved in translation (DUF1610 family)
MTRVADFLRARIDEDEQWAGFAGHETESHQIPCPACHSRALVRCNTDRRIVAMHDQDHECPESEDDSCGYWDDRACLVIKLLAVPYADHPDYDEEWRP